MTNEEARNVIECMITNIVGDFANREMTKGAKHTYDALEKAEEALEKAEKYRWHDLRKNQADLPDTTRNVLIAYTDFENDSYSFYDVAFLGVENLWYSTEHNNFEYHDEGYDVIAWKEIDLYEEK